MSTEHENEAQEVLRKIARDVRAHGLPPDAGLTAELLQVVRAAWRDGQQIAAVRIAQAWQLACETGETEFATWLGEEFPDGIGNSGTGNGYHQDDMQAGSRQAAGPLSTGSSWSRSSTTSCRRISR